MSNIYWARINPDVALDIRDYRTTSLTFVAAPPDQPWLGWKKITPEQATRMRGIIVNAANPGNSPKVFQVANNDEYEDIVREGRKGASKYLDPVATAQIENLQNELDAVKQIGKNAAANDKVVEELRKENATLSAQFAALMARLGEGPTVAIPSILPTVTEASSPVPPEVVSSGKDEPAIGNASAPGPKASSNVTITGTPRPGRKASKVDVVDADSASLLADTNEKSEAASHQ